MSVETGRPSAQSLWEKRKANRMLRRMDLHERIALQSEQTTAHALQRALAERYRLLVGVYPEQRQELRAALQQLEQTGLVAVADLLEHLHRTYSSNTWRGGRDGLGDESTDCAGSD